MKIECKSADVCIKSTYPKFKYHFKDADVSVEIQEEHAEKVLLNSDFYKSDKQIAKKITPTKKTEKKITWKEELEGDFTKKETEDILGEFKTKGELLEALSNGKLTFSESLGTKLEKVFVH